MKLSTIVNFILAIPATLFSGYIFAHLWNWFVIRKFPGLPALNFLDAVGLLMVINFLLFGIFWADSVKKAKKGAKDEDVVSLVYTLIRLVIVYPLILAIAYAWHLVIG